MISVLEKRSFQFGCSSPLCRYDSEEVLTVTPVRLPKVTRYFLTFLIILAHSLPCVIIPHRTQTPVSVHVGERGRAAATAKQLATSNREHQQRKSKAEEELEKQRIEAAEKLNKHLNKRGKQREKTKKSVSQSPSQSSNSENNDS